MNNHEEHHSDDGWTIEENKLLENLLEYQSDDGWTIEENKLFEDLLENPELIESSNTVFGDDVKEDEGGPSKKRKMAKRPRARAIPWTEEEHKLFLSGLQKFGKGKWKSISKFFVKTKTPTQIASHAQKFHNRIHNSTPLDKRRRSINDIQFVEDSTFSTYNQPNYISPQPIMPQNFDPPTIQHLVLNNISLEPTMPQNFAPHNFQYLAHNQMLQPLVFPNNNYW